MKQKQKRNPKGRVAKSVLRLPDLEVAKSAVLNSLSSPDAQRGYRHAIDEFVDWNCSSRGSSPPRLAFANSRRTISVEVALGFAAPLAANWSRFNFFLGMFPCRPQRVVSAAPGGLHRGE